MKTLLACLLLAWISHITSSRLLLSATEGVNKSQWCLKFRLVCCHSAGRLSRVFHQAPGSWELCSCSFSTLMLFFLKQVLLIVPCPPLPPNLKYHMMPFVWLLPCNLVPASSLTPVAAGTPPPPPPTMIVTPSLDKEDKFVVRVRLV